MILPYYPNADKCPLRPPFIVSNQILILVAGNFVRISRTLFGVPTNASYAVIRRVLVHT